MKPTQSIQKGLVVLDIDGTTTAQAHSVPPETVAYLSSLHAEGWRIAFVTGRNFTFGAPTLAALPFPHLFGVQNGALVLSMPDKVVLQSRYVGLETALALAAICEAEPTDVVLYSGVEHGDVCYYRPGAFAPDLREYLDRRRAAFGEIWQAVDSFSDLPTQNFASLKCFGKTDSVERIASAACSDLGLHMPLIRDPFDHTCYVAQATHPDGNKGAALRAIKKLLSLDGPCIAAGDDMNDVPLLQAADIAIAMGTAPEVLRQIAVIQAPPASEQGIIAGLRAAIERCGQAG
ncbi:MAG: HAD family phosphatase [Chlamydiia bacterium]|nr:HAD family phosphatase [Chlamydiia bacterium]